MTYFTLGTTFYNNPEYLDQYIKINLPLVDELIIVDDGSEISIDNYVKPGGKLRLFRVPTDYGFNSHGCRNLIMKMSSYDWVILTDIDRRFVWPDHSYRCIREKKLNPKAFYKFYHDYRGGLDETYLYTKFNDISFSLNDFLIHKSLFFSVGGYDEELIGFKVGDREFRDQLRVLGLEKSLPDSYISFLRNSTPYKSKPIPHIIRKLITQRIKTPEPNKPILTFKWFEIM